MKKIVNLLEKIFENSFVNEQMEGKTNKESLMEENLGLLNMQVKLTLRN